MDTLPNIICAVIIGSIYSYLYRFVSKIIEIIREFIWLVS